MGNPAARASIDKGAHSGPIQSGSPDVFIGGFPAARKGDPIGCSKHGSGIIVGGSASVLVNGKPLARMGDKTQCNVSGAAAAKTAPPQYWGGTLAKDAGKDGQLHGKNYDGRVLGAYASQEDKTGDGKYDTTSTGFALADITQGNLKSKDALRGEMRTKVLVANAIDTTYDGMSDIEGMNTTVAATGIQYGGSLGVGRPGSYSQTVGGDVTLGNFEAKAVSEVYKGNQGRYGINAEVGAEVAAVKGEVSASTDYWGILTADAKIAGTAGSAGAAGGVTAYWDTTDYSINAKVSGELALILGLKIDAGLKFAMKPIYDLFKHDDPTEKPDNGDGTITTGCTTVLVGD